MYVLSSAKLHRAWWAPPQWPSLFYNQFWLICKVVRKHGFSCTWYSLCFLFHINSFKQFPRYWKRQCNFLLRATSCDLKSMPTVWHPSLTLGLSVECIMIHMSHHLSLSQHLGSQFLYLSRGVNKMYHIPLVLRCKICVMWDPTHAHLPVSRFFGQDSENRWIAIYSSISAKFSLLSASTSTTA